jgi:transcriptional regulator with XRE-family HTH domain
VLDKKAIGNRLKEAREAKGLNKSSFAEQAGIDISQYSKAERGIEGLGPDKLKLLVNKHGINADYLVTGKGEILQNNLPTKEEFQLQSPVHFTADQLFAMYMKSVERQDKLLEAQVGILKSIESKMAQESTQAIVNKKVSALDDKLNEALAGIDTIVDQADEILQKFRPLSSEAGIERRSPFQDVDNKQGENVRDVHKRGKNDGGRKSGMEIP